MRIRSFNTAAGLALAFLLSACAHSGTVAVAHPSPSQEGKMPAMTPGPQGGKRPNVPKHRGPDDATDRISPDGVSKAPAPESPPKGGQASGQQPPPDDEMDGMDKTDLSRVLMTIRMEFIRDDVRFSTLFSGMAKGMVDALGDRYSSFMDPQEAKMFMDRMNGSFSGIGAELGPKDGHIEVMKVIPGSPAEKYGLKAGDVIVAVDDEDVVDLPIDKVVMRIRGVKDTPVAIKVFRKGADDLLTLKIVRGDIPAEPNVTWKTVKRGSKRFMVITIVNFLEGASERFAKAADEAVSQHVDGVVIDLRDDPGGDLRVAADVVCHWDRDSPVTIMERRGPILAPWMCQPGKAILADMPTAVLINGHSASASEITAGALQDDGKGRIFGEKSFGKGCGQSVMQFPDGSMLKLTTFYWKTPKGRNINKKGIEPDETVAPSPKSDKGKQDAQMDRALDYLSKGK